MSTHIQNIQQAQEYIKKLLADIQLLIMSLPDNKDISRLEEVEHPMHKHRPILEHLHDYCSEAKTEYFRINPSN